MFFYWCDFFIANYNARTLRTERSLYFSPTFGLGSARSGLFGQPPAAAQD
jgi:hypothetical protein